MLRRCLWTAAASLTLVSGLAAAQEALPAEPTLMEVLQSSAVPPLRMQERTVTAVLPGHFSGRRADAVLITNDNASLCRGPDYRRCLALGYLPTKRTIATTIKGESTLLVLDSLSSIRACSIDASHDRASLNCRTVDINKLKDYNAATLADGKLLLVDGTDGKYACSQGATSWPSCSQMGTTDRAQRKLERSQRKVFKPLDQPDKTCRVKKGEILCNDRQKLSELDDDPVAPMMRPVGLYYWEVEPEEDDWVGAVLEAVVINGYYNTGAPMEMGWWMNNASPTPPNYWQQQCLDICTQQDIDYGDLCRQSALAALIFGPVVAGGYFIACEAGRGWQNWNCRHNICGI